MTEVGKLQEVLNKWSEALGVEPLEVTGKFDSKTATFALQVSLGYVEGYYSALEYIRDYPWDAQRYDISTITEAFDRALYEELGLPYPPPAQVIIVPLEEGTQGIVDAVEEKNAELVAEGLPLIPTRVVGGGGFPWLWAGVGAVLLLGSAAVLWDARKR